MNEQFIAGFFTGEGYFSIVKIGKYKGFLVGVHLKDNDLMLLQSIKDFLGIGNITIKKNNLIHYRITKSSEIRVFIDKISPYLRGHKLEQFNNWLSVFNQYDSARLPHYRR